MLFMKDNHLKPSDVLLSEYEQSETTEKLNEFPPFEDLGEKIEMERHVYDKLKERYRDLHREANLQFFIIFEKY